ncbi:energy transducer TonB [Pedobacter frigidisoli]|uniref:Energy transducer TonB n=1 Tax=Pedobacter frigidisoli TaxID=2530455 RepID=A0A4R0P1X3_9SPHI|nr:energy transducer TonB [Pedobacter frigidisoli]TCD07150.1 energy transducer TonB [Pedobacter frigidisoli]
MKNIIFTVCLVCSISFAFAQNIKPQKFLLDTINVRGRILSIDGSAIPNVYIKTTSQDTILQNDVIYGRVDSIGYFAINGIKLNDIFTINVGLESFRYVNEGSRFITITLNPFKNIKEDTAKVTIHAKRLNHRKEVKYLVSDYLVCAFPTFSKTADFPGGKGAFLDFINSRLTYSQKAIQKNIEGKVILKFSITKAGKVENARIVNGIGYGCDEEAIRVVNLSPRWNPEIIDSKPVVSRKIVEILFKLID